MVKSYWRKLSSFMKGRFTDGGEPTLRVVGDVEVVRTEAVPGVTQEVPIDPSKYCTLWESDVVRKFKERAGERISFGPAGERDMNGYYFRRAVEAHKIPSPSKLYYRPAIAGGRPQYGEEMVDWLVDEYQKNPDFFLDATQA